MCMNWLTYTFRRYLPIVVQKRGKRLKLLPQIVPPLHVCVYIWFFFKVQGYYSIIIFLTSKWFHEKENRTDIYQPIQSGCYCNLVFLRCAQLVKIPYLPFDVSASVTAILLRWLGEHDHRHNIFLKYQQVYVFSSLFMCQSLKQSVVFKKWSIQNVLSFFITFRTQG